MLFTAEVSGDLTPLFRFPFVDRESERVGGQPLLGTIDHVEDGFVLVVGLKFGLAFALPYPQLSIDGVAIDRQSGALFLLQRETMDDGQKFADVVRADLQRSNLEDLLTCAHYNATIFHRTGIARTGSIDGQSIEDVGLANRLDLRLAGIPFNFDTLFLHLLHLTLHILDEAVSVVSFTESLDGGLLRLVGTVLGIGIA